MYRLHFFPSYPANPYQNMLYLGARAEGWAVASSPNLGQLVADLAGLGKGDIFHLHWTGPITRGSTWLASRRGLLRFQRAVNAAVRRGARLVWTVHNALAHDAQNPRVEIDLARYLAATAWRIIQLNPQTRQAVAEYYDLPAEKLVTLRHASYKGFYPEAPAQFDARAALGVPPAAPAIGFVGRLRPYKGMDILCAATQLAAGSVDDLTLLLAGQITRARESALETKLPSAARVVKHYGFVPDEEVGSWFAAADLMVFPYTRVLNSGSVLLSATYGRACILPAEPHLMALYGDQPWVSFFEPSPDPAASLAEAILAALPEAGERRSAALAYADEYTPYDMSAEYLRIICDPPA